jgi:hypothetical protein
VTWRFALVRATRVTAEDGLAVQRITAAAYKAAEGTWETV